MKKKTWLGSLLLVLLFASCSSVKKMTYVQDLNYFTSYPVNEQAEIKVQQNDKLSITVTCKSPELALPFNISNGAQGVHISENGEFAPSVNASTDAKGYVVSKDGNIDFPILGKLHVQGLTLAEVKKLIEDRIMEKNYIRDPLVLVDIMNFQITMLGEVAKKGNYTIKNNHVNLLEAIAMAGDLTTSAKTDEVMVIRTENGQRKAYPHNLRSREFYDSPAFHLQQNDVVYVKPNKVKSDGTREKNTNIIGLILSFITACATIGYLIKD